MLIWMRSFGELQRIVIECTGRPFKIYAKRERGVLEVTAPDKQDRRRRGKNDDLDAQSAAHAAFASRCTVTPRSRNGMV